MKINRFLFVIIILLFLLMLKSFDKIDNFDQTINIMDVIKKFDDVFTYFAIIFQNTLGKSTDQINTTTLVELNKVLPAIDMKLYEFLNNKLGLLNPTITTTNFFADLNAIKTTIINTYKQEAYPTHRFDQYSSNDLILYTNPAKTVLNDHTTFCYIMFVLSYTIPVYSASIQPNK